MQTKAKVGTSWLKIGDQIFSSIDIEAIGASFNDKKEIRVVLRCGEVVRFACENPATAIAEIWMKLL